MTDLVLLDVADGVATITLNRPDKLNAFASDMRERLIDRLDELASRRDARMLVMTGAGRAFCSGGDVHHMVALRERGAPYADLAPLLELGRGIVTRLAAFEIPTVAAVNGVAAGAGLNLALACDVRWASERASFGETFSRIGLHPDWGGTFTLPRHVGLAHALELSWLGETIDAAEALRIGLVQRVFAADSFATEVATLARRLADAPATSVAFAKRTLGASLVRTLDECLDAEAAAQEACWVSPDSAEGMRAFVAKRAPVFGAGRASHASVRPWSFE